MRHYMMMEKMNMNAGYSGQVGPTVVLAHS